MEGIMKAEAPVYQKIAADIAAKIMDRRYHVGEKIYARSYLASQYNVSSETARRAICVLSDLEIVEVTKGSGVIIKSYDNAVKFVHQYNDIQSLNDLKKDIMKSIQKQKEEMKTLQKSVSSIISQTERFQSFNPFIPFEIEITDQTPLLGKSISEMNFWHHTAATIVSIKRNGALMMSPGPYAVLKNQDVLYYCGEAGCRERVKNFLYPHGKAT